MTAQSVVDVILGEAKAGDKEEMLAIASVIENRAHALGVTPEQVVQDQREFNAYGKSIPKGNDAFRDMAEAALEEVRSNGPVTDAMFYATPATTKNLPSGLNKVTATSSHHFFTDPENRAIRTSVGFKKPSDISTQAIRPTNGVNADFIASIENAPKNKHTPQGITLGQMMDVGGMNLAGTPTPNAKPQSIISAAETPLTPEMGYAPDNGLRGRANNVANAASNPFAAVLGDGEELPTMPAIDGTLNYAYEGQTRRGMSPDHHSITQMQEDTVRDAGRVFDRMGINPQINSGYRSPDYNSLVDGVANSRHMRGDALDIDVTGMSMDDRVAMVDQLMSEGFTGIGGGKGSFIHVDQRPNSTSWGYRNNPLPAEIQEVIDARTAGGRLNQYPSDFGNIPTPRSMPATAQNKPTGYVSASNLDSLALSDLANGIGKDRYSSIGDQLAIDNSIGTGTPTGPRRSFVNDATSSRAPADYAIDYGPTPTTVRGLMSELGAPSVRAPSFSQSRFDNTFDVVSTTPGVTSGYTAPSTRATTSRAPADYAIDYGPTPTTVGGLMEALGAPSPAARSRAPSFSQSRFDNTFDVVSTTPGVTSGYTAPRSAPGVSVASPGPVAPAAPVGGALDLTKTTDLGLPGIDGKARAGLPTIDDGPVTMGGFGIPEKDPDTIYGRAGPLDKGRRNGLVVGGQLAGPIGAALGYTLGPSMGRRMGDKRYRGPAMGLSLPGFSGIGRMFGDNGYSTTPRGQAVAGYGRNFDANAAHRTYASLGGAQDAGSIARFEADMARERGQRNRAEGTSGGRSIGDAISEALGGFF